MAGLPKACRQHGQRKVIPNATLRGVTAPERAPVGPQFAPARRLRMLDDVFAQIRDVILSGEVPAGGRLPNERGPPGGLPGGGPTGRQAPPPPGAPRDLGVRAPPG